MDIDELKREYPFLKKVWNAYKEYDEDVDKESDLRTFYKNNITDAIGVDKETYKDICIKLLRNLNILNERKYTPPSNQEYCTYLYHWLYKETKGYTISNMLLSIVFEEFHSKLASQDREYICPYSLYNKELYETKNLVKLSYLKDNIEDIKRILKNTDDNDYCSCQKYLKDCVDIYRVMNEQICTNREKNTKYNEKICSELSQFASHYSFITLDAEIEKKRIPDIQSGERNEVLSNCPSTKETPVPDTESPANTEASKSNTSSTVIGSMVGIPPFLVLIYKFTPVGKFFRFGNKNNTKITSNFDKEIENELFHVMQKDSNIKDIQSKYNVGYEPI